MMDSLRYEPMILYADDKYGAMRIYPVMAGVPNAKR